MKPTLLRELATALLAAVWLNFLVPASLAGLWLSGEPARRLAAVKALIATLCALAISKAIGAIWYHARPFAADIGNTYLWHAPVALTFRRA